MFWRKENKTFLAGLIFYFPYPNHFTKIYKKSLQSPMNRYLYDTISEKKKKTFVQPLSTPLASIAR